MTSTSERNRVAEIQSGTHAVIDLDHYDANLRNVASIAGPDTAVLAVIKANAYGHGAVACAESAIATGCRYLGVARIDEAIELRNAGIEAPILVIGPPNIAQIGIALAHDISLTVATTRSLDAVVAEAQRLGRVATVHVKVDTGLHRYGARHDLAMQLVGQASACPAIYLEGLYTHFSSADEEDQGPTAQQIEQFESTMLAMRDCGITPPLVHVANSAATLTGMFPNTNMVRAGIVSYGLDPSDEIPAPTGFKQILMVNTVITRRFTLKKGESVSYNRTHTASEDEEAAAVPIGYADGIERHLSNTGWFVHGATRCPIIGRVCMDQTVIAVPRDAMEGDVVTVIADADHSQAMTVANVGEFCGTNTYEPVTRLAARVPRLYVRSGTPVSWAVPLLGESGRVSPS